MAQEDADQQQMDFLASLFRVIPGDTAQKRLNYLQDLTSKQGLNLDVFGTRQPVLQQWEDPASEVRAMYGNNAGFQAVFQAIDEGVDPLTAIRGAIADDRFPELDTMDDRQKQDYTASLTKVARDYSYERAETASNKAAFERQQAKTVAEAPITLDEVLTPRTQYDAAVERLGFEPSAEDLMKAYSQQLWANRPTPMRTPMRTERRQAAPAPPPTGDSVGVGDLFRSLGRGVVGVARAIPNPVNIATNIATGSKWAKATSGEGKKQTPDFSGMTEQQARNAIRSVRENLSGVLPFVERSMPEDYGFGGPAGDVRKQIFEGTMGRAANIARQKELSSPESNRVLQNLAYALLLQGE